MSFKNPESIIRRKPDGGEAIEKASNYDSDPAELKNIVARHLAKIYLAKHKKKISEILDKSKSTCK